MGARWQLLFGNPFIHSAVMFRRAVVADELGGYDPTWHLSQDFELWSRLLLNFEGCNLEDNLVDLRVHAGSITARRGPEMMETMRRAWQRNICVQQQNLAVILDDAALAEEWPPLWTAMNIEWLLGQPRDPERALDLVDRVFRRFVELYPRAEHDADIAAHRAEVLWTLARLFATRNRPACAKALFKHFRCRWRALRKASSDRDTGAAVEARCE
jgi:hypothetical protein